MKKIIVLAILLVLVFRFSLYRIYSPRVSAFGCFDDCFSYAAGYFINHGKVLYSDIFYNHQMLPAYISSEVQSLSNPINLYDLVLKHRQFVMLTAFLFDFFLILRFGIPAFFFFIFYEFTKFYIFGDRFLAEGLLVYPLTYLTFIGWNRLKNRKIENFDYLLAGFLCWLVVFLREIFAPVALVLFLYILFPYRKYQKFKNISMLIFGLLTATSLLTVNFKDYYFELVTVNNSFFSQGLDSVKIIFYPLFVLINNKLNLFWIVFGGINLLFITSIIYLAVIKKNYKYFFVFVPLILANLRVVPPGDIFYESFHMIPFYGIFLSLSFLLINELKKYNFKIWISFLGISIVIFLYYITSPQAFFKEKINTQDEFFTNYSNILQIGEITKKISNPKDTLFVDGYDEVIYWVAQRPSPYRYSMYTSFMPDFPIYSNVRLKMFENNPPAVYYGSCPKEKNSQRLIPDNFVNDYVRLDVFGKPSCVFINKNKLKEITAGQWKNAREFGYSLPK